MISVLLSDIDDGLVIGAKEGIFRSLLGEVISIVCSVIGNGRTD